MQSLVQFTGAGGGAPGAAADTDGAGLNFTGGLVFGSDGKLYGVAAGGGPEGGGVVYRLTISSPISDWKLAYLGDANASDLGDLDNDGMTNLLEYALLTTPGAPDSQNVPAGAIAAFPDDTRLAIVVPRDPARTDISIIVEATSTLDSLPWEMLATSTNGGVFTGPGYYGGDSATAGVRFVTVRDIQPFTATTQRFVRVRITH